MQTETDYTLVDNLLALMPEIPTDTIISRTIFDDRQIKGTLFGFAAGQELTEHTASRPAILHFLSGDAQLTLGDDSFVAQAGTWVHMPPNLAHSIRAQGPVIMLLILLR
jgi:quercetin dioxygenase-like cupin family protein